VSTADWAERYAAIGLALTWTPPGEKGPRHLGWNRPENAITTPAAARRHWSANPAHGIACLLEASRLVSLDVDDEEHARRVLGALGMDLDELRRSAPCIVGRHFRLMYRAPDVALKHRTLAWPKRENPCASTVLLELRAGAVADTLPPTRHVVTGRQYRWENPPAGGLFPPLPPRLLELWRDWPQSRRTALALCPWAPPPRAIPPARPRRSNVPGDSIIERFNAAHEVTAILEQHGYQRRGQRFVAPESGHAAGVVLLKTGRVYCHHQGDVLSGEHALDGFDCFRLLAHGGDLRSAVTAAAQALGLPGSRAPEQAT
jgi:putative DNA primase/helicase